jgi:predicted DCC family thiol-disulfide oxidoreductase YuxK
MREIRIRRILRIEEEGFPKEMRLRRRDGSFLGGIDAIAWMCRRAPGLWIAGVLISTPGIHWMASRIYRWVARNRFCLGDLCEVIPRPANRRHPVTIPFLEMP